MRSGSRNAKYLNSHNARQSALDEAIGTEMIRRFRVWMNSLKRWYDENQPRAPAGTHEGGQWIDAGSQFTSISNEFRNNGSRHRSSTFQVAGGFEDGDMSKTAQQFISKNCKGGILRRFPSQFLEMTLDELFTATKRGDPGAKTCLKLLSRDEYRK